MGVIKTLLDRCRNVVLEPQNKKMGKWREMKRERERVRGVRKEEGRGRVRGIKQKSAIINYANRNNPIIDWVRAKGIDRERYRSVTWRKELCPLDQKDV